MKRRTFLATAAAGAALAPAVVRAQRHTAYRSDITGVLNGFGWALGFSMDCSFD